MDLSGNYNDIIEKKYKAIISKVPFKDILIDLRSDHILTSTEVKRLQKYDDHKQAGFEILEILQSRSGTDFFKFCDILKSSNIENVQNLGIELENAANKKRQNDGKLRSRLIRCFDQIHSIDILWLCCNWLFTTSNMKGYSKVSVDSVYRSLTDYGN